MQRARRALSAAVALAPLAFACRGRAPKEPQAARTPSAPTLTAAPSADTPSVAATLASASAVVTPPVAAPFVAVEPLSLDAAALALARAHRDDYVRDLTTLVNTDSGTDDAGGLARVATFVEKRLRELGAEVEVRPAPPSAGKLVHATFHGTGTRKLLLLGHLDTVFGKGEAARRPFRTEGERAFGPGVADDKGGVALVLHALALLRERNFRAYGTLSVVFDPDEEKGSPGSRELIRSLSAEQDAVLSFEPPDGERVIVSTNGIALVDLTVKGRAAHAGSAPEQGRNAALELAHQIVRLKDLGDAQKGTTVNFTVLRAGERINIIPELATATADMRYSDPSEPSRVEATARRLVTERLVPGTTVDVHVDPRRPPLPRNAASERLALLARRVYLGLGRTLEPVAMRYGTDAGFAYQPERAAPAVLEGLGVAGQGLHSSDEWADLESVVPRLYLSMRLVELLSTGVAE